MKLYWKFQGVGGSKAKNHPWGSYGYYLEAYNLIRLWSVIKIVWFQKISILPPQMGFEFPGRRGDLKSHKFKAMYEAKLEFPGGWGGENRKDLFR